MLSWNAFCTNTSSGKPASGGAANTSLQRTRGALWANVANMYS